MPRKWGWGPNSGKRYGEASKKEGTLDKGARMVRDKKIVVHRHKKNKFWEEDKLQHFRGRSQRRRFEFDASKKDLCSAKRVKGKKKGKSKMSTRSKEIRINERFFEGLKNSERTATKSQR